MALRRRTGQAVAVVLSRVRRRMLVLGLMAVIAACVSCAGQRVDYEGAARAMGPGW